MESNQLKLLTDLAQKIRTAKKDKRKILASLQSAKILTKQGNFTSQYRHLSKVGSK